MVEPVDPFEGRVFHCFEGTPWSTAVDHLGLVKAVDRLGQSVVVAVPDAADRWFDPGFGETLGVLDGYVLGAPIAMMDEAAPMGRPAIVKRLFQSIENKAGVRRPAGPPAYDPPSIGIDDEGDVDKPRPGRDVGDPKGGEAKSDTHSLFGAGA